VEFVCLSSAEQDNLTDSVDSFRANNELADLVLYFVLVVTTIVYLLFARPQSRRSSFDAGPTAALPALKMVSSCSSSTCFQSDRTFPDQYSLRNAFK
jgi:hypothetical protein